MRIALTILAASSAFAQQNSSTAPLDVITASMQDYARGITENRFDVACKLSRFDPAGKVVKVKATTHTLEFTKGVYKSSSSESTPPDWNATWVARGNRRTLGLEMHTDDGALFPVFVFSPAKRNRMVLDVAGGTERRITVVYRPAVPCQAFTAMAQGFGLADISCGSGQIVLDPDAAIPLRSSFEGAGFPLISGKESMSGFHVDSEFVPVVLPVAKRPFLFPSKVRAVFTFSESKVTVECDYTGRLGKKK